MCWSIENLHAKAFFLYEVSIHSNDFSITLFRKLMTFHLFEYDFAPLHPSILRPI